MQTIFIVQLESKESLEGWEVQQAATAEDGAPRQHFSSHCWWTEKFEIFVCEKYLSVKNINL